ncbi:MAG: helix-turn-helix domain-containing protein [Patescibacteria group bacterium]
MKFLTRNEVAAMLRVHPKTVQRWLKNRSLKGFKLGKGKTSLWRISEEEITKFLKRYQKHG